MKGHVQVALNALREGEMVHVMSTDYREDLGVWKVCGVYVETGNVLARSGISLRAFKRSRHRFFIPKAGGGQWDGTSERPGPHR